jgi:hypothetical protein
MGLLKRQPIVRDKAPEVEPWTVQAPLLEDCHHFEREVGKLNSVLYFETARRQGTPSSESELPCEEVMMTVEDHIAEVKQGSTCGADVVAISTSVGCQIARSCIVLNCPRAPQMFPSVAG